MSEECYFGEVLSNEITFWKMLEKGSKKKIITLSVELTIVPTNSNCKLVTIYCRFYFGWVFCKKEALHEIGWCSS